MLTGSHTRPPNLSVAGRRLDPEIRRNKGPELLRKFPSKERERSCTFVTFDEAKPSNLPSILRQSIALNHCAHPAVETFQASKTHDWKVKPMSIPIPAETPDPNIDKPVLPVPPPDVDPPPTMPPVIPKGDPPSEEPPATLEDEFFE
jgi:hypothetical protein